MPVFVRGVSEATTGLVETNAILSSSVQINSFTFLKFICLDRLRYGVFCIDHDKIIKN